MKIHPFARAISLVLAAAVTLGVLGGIDHLASQDPVSPQWAAAVMARHS